MFDALSDRLQAALGDVRSRGKLSEDDVNAAMRQVRLALLEGLLRFLGEIDELWASMDIDVERVIERGDEVLAVLLVTLTGRGSGVEMESRIAQRWTLRDGQLLRMKLYGDADAAVAEFG